MKISSATTTLLKFKDRETALFPEEVDQAFGEAVVNGKAIAEPLPLFGLDFQVDELPGSFTLGNEEPDRAFILGDDVIGFEIRFHNFLLLGNQRRVGLILAHEPGFGEGIVTLSASENDVIEHLDADDMAGKDKRLRDLFIAERRLRISGGVVVDRDKGSRIMEKGGAHNLPDIDGGSVDGAYGMDFRADDSAFGIDEDEDKDFPVDGAVLPGKFSGDGRRIQVWPDRWRSFSDSKSQSFCRHLLSPPLADKCRPIDRR
jgi:hypothetical protein